MKEYQKILGNILASESLNIIEANVSTASFNIETRTLKMPFWVSNSEDIDKDAFNMFLAHEVAHALYTPMLDREATKHIPFSYINIIEDVRIEKLIKRKYLALSSIFKRGYANINSRFFKNFNSETAGFADRINVYFKCGDLHDIKFSTKEQQIVDELKTIETFEDVLYYANLLKEMKDEEKYEPSVDDEQDEQSNEEQDEQDQTRDDFVEASTGDEEIESEASSGDTDDEEPEKEIDTEESTEEIDTEESTDDEESESAEIEPEAIDQNDYVSETEQMNSDFYEDINSALPGIYKVVERTVLKSDYLDILEATQVRGYITGNEHVPFNVIYDDLKKDEGLISALGECKQSAGVMNAEFNRKKAANMTKNSQTAKSGIIDVNALHRYKTSDDIFLSKVVHKAANNHAIVIVLDVSGSMHHIIQSVIKQIITIGYFCRMSNIKFEVITYTSYGSNNLDIIINTPLKSNMTLIDFEKMATVLLCAYGDTSNYQGIFSVSSYMEFNANEYSVNVLNSGGTPTTTALLESYSIVKNISRDSNTIVNAMLFTDGQPNSRHVISMTNPDNSYPATSIYGGLIKFDLAGKEHTIEVTPDSESNNVSTLLIDKVLSEFKKLGNCIFVYTPTTCSNNMYKVLYTINRNIKPKNDILNDYEELGTQFKKQSVIDLGYNYTSVSSCLCLNAKVFKNVDKFDTITTSIKFDSTKDSNIVKAINAKMEDKKQTISLLKIFAEKIASNL